MRCSSITSTFLISIMCLSGVLCTTRATLAQDAAHLGLISDAAGMFNERGYLKSNSFSLDANEVINDFNGNLIWTKRLRYLPITQNSVHCDLKIAYNGSVGHTSNSTIGDGCDSDNNKHNSINAPEWILSINNIAIQTFNFENEGITWASATQGDTSLPDDVSLLVNGYHRSYDYHSPSGQGSAVYGTVSILMGDGSVTQYNSMSDSIRPCGSSFYLIPGEYRSCSKDDRSRGYIEQSTGYFTLFQEDGIKVTFKPYRPIWKIQTQEGPDFADSIMLYLPVAFTDQMNRTVAVGYDSLMNITGQPERMYGRPLVSGTAGYTFDWRGLLYGGPASHVDLKIDNAVEWMLNFTNPVSNTAPSVALETNRGYLIRITDRIGRRTTFTYENYFRRGDNMGRCTHTMPDLSYSYSGKCMKLWLPRLQSVSYSEGGRYQYRYLVTPSYVQDSVDFGRDCGDQNTYPCKKSDAFAAVGRDPYFTNMIASRTRYGDASDTANSIISRDSLSFSWHDSVENTSGITINDSFFTTRWTYQNTLSSAYDSHCKRVDLAYRQYPEKGTYSIQNRDRGWALKLVSRIESLDAVVGSIKTYQTWDLGTCGGYCGGTLLLTADSTVRDGGTLVSRYQYTFYGESSEDSVSSLAQRTVTNPWGIITKTYYNTSHLDITGADSYFSNVLIDSVKQVKDDTLIDLDATRYYTSSSTTGYVGQPSDQVNYLVEHGTLTDSVISHFEYEVNNTLNYGVNGELRKRVSANGDSVVYHYCEYIPNPPGYVNSTGDSNATNPVIYKEWTSSDSLRVPPYRRFNENGSSWYKMEQFTNDPPRITVDSSYRETGTKKTVNVSCSFPGSRYAVDTVLSSQIVTCRLRIPGFNSYCDSGTFAQIEKNDSPVMSVWCREFDWDTTFNVAVNANDRIAGRVNHVSTHGGFYLASYTYCLDNCGTVMDIITDTVPDKVVHYQSVDNEGKLIRSVDPNAIVSEVNYDPLDRASRIVLPGNFAQRDPRFVEVHDSLTLSPTFDAQVDIDGRIVFCTADSVKVDCRNYTADTSKPSTRDTISALLKFADSSLVNLHPDSAFLYVYCLRTNCEGHMKICADSGGASCGATCSVLSGVVRHSNFCPTVGMNKIDVSLGWSADGYDLSTDQTFAITGDLNTGEDTYFATSEYPDPDRRPILKIYGIRNGSYDSVYTVRYNYQDIPNATNVTSLTKSDSSKFTPTQRVHFDGLNRAITHQSIDSSGSALTTSATYDFADRPDTSIDQLGFRTISAYDNLDRKTTTTYADSASSYVGQSYNYVSASSVGLDTLGFLALRHSGLFKTQTRDENGHYANQYKDVRDKLRVTEQFVGSTSLKTYFDYDDWGNLRTVVKPNGDRVEYRYNSLGQLVQEWGADYDVINYKYDKKGRLVLKQDGVLASLDTGSVHYWEYTRYDGADRVAESGRARCNGNDTTRTSMRRFFYDQDSSSYSKGRLSVSYNTAASSKYGEHYDYDPRGRIKKQINYFNATIDSTLIHNQYVYALHGDALTLQFTYDLADQVTSVTYPDGMVVKYSYDQRGRLSKVGDASVSAKYGSLSYTDRNEISQLVLGNSLQTVDYVYNARGWLNTVNGGTTTGSDKFGERLYYYGRQGDQATPAYYNGNIGGQDIKVVDSASYQYRYTYDDVDRLTKVTMDKTEPVDEEWFYYDANGNRSNYVRVDPDAIPVHRDSTRYLYLTGTNKLDSLRGAISNKYAFDAYGNVTWDSTKKATSSYDLYNQLSQVVFDNYGYSDNVLTMGYNASGERVWKNYVYYWQEPCPPPGGEGPLNAPPSDTTSLVDSAWLVDTSLVSSTSPSDTSGATTMSGIGGGTCTYSGTAKTHYIVSMGKVWAEYGNVLTGGTPRFRYIYAGDQRIAVRDAQNRPYFYLNDHLGSAWLVVDSVGNISDRYRYRAFGDFASKAVTVNQPRRYTGQPYDEDGGLHLSYYGARYYDATLGQFTQIDPSRHKYPGWGPYVYTLDNPMRLVDKDGKGSSDEIERKNDEEAARAIREANTSAEPAVPEGDMALINEGNRAINRAKGAVYNAAINTAGAITNGAKAALPGISKVAGKEEKITGILSTALIIGGSLFGQPEAVELGYYFGYASTASSGVKLASDPSMDNLVDFGMSGLSHPAAALGGKAIRTMLYNGYLTTPEARAIGAAATVMEQIGESTIENMVNGQPMK